MAGIGFTLKKLFQEEGYGNRVKGYLYSALVAAGPWIAAVITVNLLIFIMEFSLHSEREKELFMGTIVYSFVFSQIITAPWQMLITRYISDKLYVKEYEYIRPSFLGLSRIVFFMGILASGGFYLFKPIPFYYKLMAIYLFILLTVNWILMVYLSAVKNYELIAKGYIYGGLLSVFLTVYLLQNPIHFVALPFVSNLLFSYLMGMTLTVLILMYNFLSTFYVSNGKQYDFIRYLNKFPSLVFVGLFYTLGLWVDDIIMWFSIAGVNVYETYLYAPVYDNAVFLAYLTIIPTMVLFLVSVETEFYDTYKKYYGLANRTGTLAEIGVAKDAMQKKVYSELLNTFQIQAILSVSLVIFAKPLFEFFNLSIISRDIFQICTLGALCNIFILLIILILLYYEMRSQAVGIAFLFLIGNFVLTIFFSGKGLEYYGYGFFLGSLFAFIVAVVTLSVLVKKLNFRTFTLQPLFVEKERGVFVNLAEWLNKVYSNKRY